MHINLRNVKVSAEERKRYLDFMSNWDNLYGKLSQGLADGGIDENDVLKMLKVEVTTKRRLAIATRLLAAYHKLVKQEDERRLTAALSR